MRAWRGPHKIARVLQDGRVYILDTGQKVHFRLHYQQFDYSSTESDEERSDVLLSSVQINPDETAILSLPMVEPASIPEIPISPLPAMEPLFS